MLAILGSSGSGKTTLLDVLSGRQSNAEITGSITPGSVAMKKLSAYVRQDDRLLPNLTVKETLMYVSRLKLPPSFCSNLLESRVMEVIDNLGLRKVADEKVGSEEIRGISGGERRRVTIGVQLLLDPS